MVIPVPLRPSPPPFFHPIFAIIAFALSRLFSPSVSCHAVGHSPFCKNVKGVRETQISVEQQAPQGVFVCDHGRAIAVIVGRVSI